MRRIHSYTTADFRRDVNSGPVTADGHPKFFFSPEGAVYCYGCIKEYRLAVHSTIKRDRNAIVGTGSNPEDGNVYCKCCENRIPSKYAEAQPHGF